MDNIVKLLDEINILREEFYIQEDKYEQHLQDIISQIDKIYNSILSVCDREDDSNLIEYIKNNIDHIAMCINKRDMIGVNDFLCGETTYILKFIWQIMET